VCSSDLELRVEVGWRRQVPARVLEDLGELQIRIPSVDVGALKLPKRDARVARRWSAIDSQHAPRMVRSAALY